MRNSDITSDGKTEYEARQNFNPIVRYLHSIRHRRVEAFAKSLDKRARCRIVEIGAAHGKSFSLINQLADVDYLGIEIEAGFCDVARQRYGHFDNFSIVHANACDRADLLAKADIVMALETFEHIPDHRLLRLIADIATVRPKRLICSVPNEVGPIVGIKNVGSAIMGYMRHKEYTWLETTKASLYMLDALPPHGTGHKGFDWRKLRETLRQHFKIETIHTSPFDGMPKALSPSIMFDCVPRA